ncbi:MAG: hypothetical protein ACLR4Z_09640 [Butyricicoccaceae bacterium]
MMKKILISYIKFHYICLLPNLATTKFLILKQAKKLVMRMSTRKPAPGNRNIVDSRVTEASFRGRHAAKDLLAYFRAPVRKSAPAISLLK